MKNLIFCHDYVGMQLGEWLLNKNPNDIAAVVVIEENNLSDRAVDLDIPIHVFKNESNLMDFLIHVSAVFDFGFLLWWPKIISSELIKLCDRGFVNTHPSLLPYNKGKHVSFWTLVDQSPFGVTLHFVDDGIDTGPIIAQHKIDYDWEDNAESLYLKSREMMIELFKKEYLNIVKSDKKGDKQIRSQGSFHYAFEINAASKLDLDRLYTCRDLLNLLRARTFQGYPACWFEEHGKKYEVRVSIQTI